MKLVIGIDPGKAGGIVAIGSDDDPIYSHRANGPDGYDGKGPANPSAYNDALEMAWAAFGVRPSMVVLEIQQAMPKQGVTSTFRTGCGYGIWLGALAARRWPYVVLRAKDWRKRAGITVPRGGDPKTATIALVQARLPTLDLTPGRIRKPHDGIADAAGMALAARALLAGGL